MQCEYCMSLLERSQSYLQVAKNYLREKCRALRQISASGRDQFREFSQYFSDYCDFCCGDYENGRYSSNEASMDNNPSPAHHPRKDTNYNRANNNNSSAKNDSRSKETEISYIKYNIK